MRYSRIQRVLPAAAVTRVFRIIKNWSRDNDGVGNSSVMRFEGGAHGEVFDSFAKSPDLFARIYRNEQCFLSDEFRKTVGLTWWPDTWCKSYTKHCLAKGVRRLFSAPAIPEGCKVVVFHGRPNPPEAASRWIYRTEKPLRPPKIAKPARWILDHWR